MQYELTTIDQMMTGLESSFGDGGALPAGLVYSISHELTRAIRDVKASMLASVAQHSEQGTTSLYVAHHARAISAHCDAIYETYRSQDGQDPHWQERRQLLLSICEHLETLLAFMQKQFPDFFDARLPVPFSAFDRHRQRLARLATDLDRGRHLPGINPALIDVCLEPALQFAAEPALFEYRSLGYLYDVYEKIISLFQSSNPDYNLALHKLLQNLNFNSPAYIQYCIDQVGVKIGSAAVRMHHFDLDDYARKLESYTWYIKTVNQEPVRKGFALRPDLPTVQQTMSNWFLQEKQYVENIIKLGKGIIDGVSINEQRAPKLLLDISINGLVAVFRAWYESGILKVPSQTEGMRLFCEIFSTKGADNLSFESFKSKFFNKEQQGIMEGINLFQNSVKVLRKY